jgi:chromosome partitioning protein
MAKIVAFASYKGGTGKTTLAYNMVERAGAAGLRACLCDYDPQHVAAGFERVRRDQMSCGGLSPDTPALDVMAADLGPDMLERLDALRNSPYKLVICDLPGAANFNSTRFLDNVDLILAPITAGPADLLVADEFVWHMKRVQLEPVFVPSLAPVINRRREMMLKAVAERGLPVCDAVIVNRVAHHDAMEVGQGVCEFAPNSPAAQEINHLWMWLAHRLRLPATKEEIDE